MALLGVIEFAPFILISLPAGVWVDRLRRKPILVAADVGRALLLASIPVAHWLGVLTIWQLYVVGFAVGFLTVFFDVSYQSYLPSLVARDQLIEGNSKLEISRSGAQLGGPGLGGRARRGADCARRRARGCDQLPRLGDLPLPDPQGGNRAHTGRAAGRAGDEGRGRRRACAGCSATATCAGSRRRPQRSTFSATSSSAVILVFAVRELGLRPGVIGLVFSVSSVGYLLGALIANRLSRRFGVGPTIIIGALRLDVSRPPRGRAGVKSDPVSDRCAGDLEPGRPDLQHHAGQLPPGDHARNGSRGG